MTYVCCDGGGQVGRVDDVVVVGVGITEHGRVLGWVFPLKSLNLLLNKYLSCSQAVLVFQAVADDVERYVCM